MPANFSFKPTLPGQAVTLVPLGLDHFDALWEAIGDSRVRELTGSHTEFSAEAVREWMASRDATTDRLDLAVIDNASRACVGEVVLNDFDPHNASCAFRILLGPRGQGRGLGTEATRLIVGYGFEKLGLHRISLGVFAFNPRACRVYEKVGFVAEGVARDALWWDGAWHDEILMAILAPQWSVHRGYAAAAQR